MTEHPHLHPEQLTWSCDGIETAGVAADTGALIGQDRAVDALRLGLELYGRGYNIFLSGLTGTRRAESVQNLIERLRASCRLVPDRVFVHNFAEPTRPVLVTLPKGDGVRFAADMQQFFHAVLRLVPNTLASTPLAERRRAIQSRYAESEKELYTELVGECSKAGLALVKLDQDGGAEPEIFPVFDGKPVPPEALDVLVHEGKLPEADAKRLAAAREHQLSKLYEVRRRGQDLALEMMAEIESLARNEARQVIAPRLDALRRSWRDPRTEAYFAGIETYLLDNLGVVMAHAEALKTTRRDDGVPWPRELEVTVLPRAEPDRPDGWDCPVIYEGNPSPQNLFGNILPPDEDGPRLSHIEVGSILRADGGYLIVRLTDVLERNGVWPALKRVFKTGMLEIRPVENGFGPISPLKPDVIRVVAKLIVIGEPGAYELLAAADPEFKKVFKVHAQFDTTMPRTDDNLRHYAAFVQGIRERAQGDAEQGDVLAAAPSGLGRLAECGSRIAGSRRRLSTRFGDLSDIYHEASYLAQRRAAKRVERQDVLAAEAKRRERMTLAVTKYLEAVREGTFKLEVDGSRVGQLNGLVVIDTGAWVYGRPCRISAQVGVGSKGVVDIERESELSGPIHEKGVNILGGYLLGAFAGDVPLRLSATICFEQSYSGVDGDSASSTELCAILSALSGVPLRQGLAATGSVDQFGRIQAVGGVNEKIEGYFAVCRELGLTGEQGVLIPASNVEDLMLDPEVVEAAAAGRFRVWAVETVEQGLEILSGVPAGSSADGEESILGRARQRLEGFARAWREYR